MVKRRTDRQIQWTKEEGQTDKYNGQKKDRQTNTMDKRRTDRQIQWAKEKEERDK
jgi:hypothetical protein